MPVLLNPFAGHGMRIILKVRIRWVAVAQWFAEQIFAVLVTDGRGTPGRGKAWEKSVYGDRLTAVPEDRTDALHAAAAVLRHPEVFHAAVACAAPTDGSTTPIERNGFSAIRMYFRRTATAVHCTRRRPG